MKPHNLLLMLDLRIGILNRRVKRLMAEHATMFAAGALPSDEALAAINAKIRAAMERFHFFSDLRNLLIRVEMEAAL